MLSWSQGPQETVLGLFFNAADSTPDNIFLDFEGDKYTYGQAYERVMRLAKGLRKLDVQRGDSVVSMLDNGPDAIFLWLACNAAGAISVAINTALKHNSLANVVNNAGAKVVISEPDYVSRFTTINDRFDDVEWILYRGEERVDLGAFQGARLDDYRLDGSDDRFLPDPDDLTALVYTGGTTGPSKGCMISHAYLCNQARINLEVTGRTPDEVMYNALPIFHMNLLCMTLVPSIMLKATAAVGRRFSVSRFWPEIERSGARIVMLLGTMTTLIGRAPDTPAMRRCRGQLRMIVGAPFSAELEQICKDRFGVERVGVHMYGLTEAVPATHVPVTVEPRPGSAGLRNDVFEVRLFDDDDHEVGAMEIGEIAVRPLRPHAMFDGYWRRPEDTLRVMRNLWFHTGDLGRFDEDGWFWFVDRKKDYVRRRGENIASMEMEDTYLEHPDIEELAYHAILSDLSEDDVKVTAVLKKGATLTPAELFEWSKDRIPYFALPRYIEFRKDLPKNQVGRVQKFLLRDEGRTPATWDREEAGAEFERR